MMEMFVLPKLSLNTACVVMHSSSLRHFRETAWNGGHNPLVTKQNLIQLLCSACLSTQLSPTHASFAYYRLQCYYCST